MRPNSADRLRAGLGHGGGVGEFERRHGDAAERGERLLRLGQQRRVDVPQHHGGARLQHALGGGVADALRAAGDDGDAAFEVELVHDGLPPGRPKGGQRPKGHEGTLYGPWGQRTK